MFFDWIFRRRQPPPEPKTDYELWLERMEPLGFHRNGVLYCLDAGNPNPRFGPLTYFNPPPGTSLAEALQDHLEHLFVEAAKYKGPGAISAQLIPAAGLLTFGRLDMAEFIISNLPFERIVTDHGAGKFFTLPYAIAGVLLPMPE
jgi:hypothetical protein